MKSSARTPRSKHSAGLALSALAMSGLLLGGCASAKKGAIANSLETVSGGYETQGIWKLEQIRGTSVNGLMPFQTIGDVFHYKPRRGALGAVGISTDKETYVVTHNFPFDGKTNNDADAAAAVKTVTTNLRALAMNGAESVTKNIDLASLKAELAELEKKKAAESDTTKRTALDTEILQKSKESETLVRAIGDLDKAKTTAEAELNKALSKSNLIIARWATDAKTSGGGKAGTIFSGSGSRDDTFKGYVILAGFQVKNIMIGEKLIRQLKDQTKALNLGSDYTDWIGHGVGSRIHVVTSLLKADHVAYLSERDLVSELKLHLRFKASELKNSAAWLKNLDEIVADYASTLGQSYSNSGYIRQSADVKSQTLTEERAQQETANQSTVMSITTEVRDLFKIYQNLKSAPVVSPTASTPPSGAGDGKPKPVEQAK